MNWRNDEEEARESQQQDHSHHQQQQHRPLTIFYGGKTCVRDVTEIQVNIIFYFNFSYQISLFVWVFSVFFLFSS